MGLAGLRGCTFHRTDLLSSPTRTAVVARALVVLRAAVAVAIAAVVTDVIVDALPRALDVRTDIVGYPIFANFNVRRYVWVFALWALFFPFAALAIDIALGRLTRRRLPPADWPTLDRSPKSETPRRAPIVGIGRTAFVGAVLGVEVAMEAILDGSAFLLAVAGIAALYGAVAVGAARALPDRIGTLWDRLAAVNLFGTVLTVIGLYGVSRATQVRVLENGRVYEYPWLPLWLALLGAAVLVSILAWALRRARMEPAIRHLERRVLLLVVAPILLFLVMARLPGEVGPIDFFHEGELMAAANLTADGAVPWRDLMFVHGFLHDVLSPWIGIAVFEDTRWGVFAGLLMLVGPMYFISQYFLLAYLFRDSVLALIGAQAAVVLGLFADFHFRFVLLPIALLLMAAFLRTPTWPWAAALAAVLVVQAVISPETTIAIPAVVGVIALSDLWSYDRARGVRAGFRRTGLVVAGGLIALSVLFSAFAAFRILDDFIFFYRTFLAEHALTGGIPVNWGNDYFSFAAYGMPLLVVLTIWFFATARRARRAPRVDDWVMAALAVVVLLYYPKFLGRADYPHLFQVLPVAAPLFAYTVYRALSLFDGWRWKPWVTGATALAVVLVSPLPILDRAEAVPERVSVEAHFDPVPQRLGFLSPNATSLETIADLGRLLDHYLEPDESVFDFSNNPVLFHYLLDRPASSRYFHVSMALRRGTQADLIGELERREPKLVISTSTLRFGLPSWDGISNQVRHYDVSEYILDHYRPLLFSHDFVLLARNGSGLRLPQGLVQRLLFQQPDTSDLYFKALPCEWGLAPNFLTTGPSERDRADGIELRLRPTDGVITVTGWAADLEARAPAQHVVAAVGPRVYGDASPDGERAEVAGGLGDEAFLRVGFTMLIPAVVPLDQLRFYGLTRDGAARELIYAPTSGLAPRSRTPDRVLFGGRTYRVIPGGIHGWAETAVAPRPTFELELPQGAARADYDWLEVRTSSRFGGGTLAITDTRGDPTRTITFAPIDRGQKTVHVQLAACSQWRGFGDRLYLENGGGEALSAVRLIR